MTPFMQGFFVVGYILFVLLLFLMTTRVFRNDNLRAENSRCCYIGVLKVRFQTGLSP